MFTLTLQYSEAMKISKKLAHSMSTEATRYYLNGFYVCKSENKFYAVSTDGHRLTRIEICPEVEGDFEGVIFPSVAVKQIESLEISSNKKTSRVTFTIDGLSYRIAHGEQIIGGKLVEGTYPDFTRVIPDWKTFANEYGDCGYNARYMADIMKAASYDPDQFKPAHGRPIRMFFQGSSPGVIFEQDESVLYVIMPLRCTLGHHKHPEAEQATEQATAA